MYSGQNRLLNLNTLKKMKRNIILTCMAIALMMMPLSMRAQQLDFGIKGGLTLSNLYIDKDDLDDENARTGFHAGFFLQLMVMETFGLRPELLYTTKGAEGEYGGVIDQTVTFNVEYIDLPLLLTFRPVEVVELYAGPYVGYLLNSSIQYEGTIEGESEIDREHLKSMDYGLTAGIAANFGNLRLGARYHLGRRELADSNASRLLLGESKHSYGQLYIAFVLSSK